MSLFSHSHSSSVSLGIDIGTTNIKAAELSATGKDSFQLSNYAILETAGNLDHVNNALQSSSLKPLESDLVSYLQLLQREAKFKTNKVTVSLPAFTAFTTLLEMPEMGSKETVQSLTTEAKHYIPIPISTATLDWIKVGEKIYPDGSKKQLIFLVSIPNEKIETYHDIFAKAGLQLEAYEIENMSSVRALTWKLATPHLIIDIGGRSTALSVGTQGLLKYSGQTDFSSGSMTQALATALNVSARRADVLKRQTQIVGQGGNHELSTILIPIIDVIINEANRIKSGFESSYAQKVEGVIIAGSGANMPGFDSYLAKQFGLPVTTANPLGPLAFPPEITSFSKELSATLTVAIGLALKNLLRP